MATTTNFGWETPDDTDLVKDGAAAIRTALGGVDTSFVDLKGGTTSQILAKNSGTDLDFIWTTPNANGMTLLSTTTLSGSSTTISSISSAYTDLAVYIFGITYSTAAYPKIAPNASTSISSWVGTDGGGGQAGFNDYIKMSGYNWTAANASNATGFLIDNYASTTAPKSFQIYGMYHEATPAAMRAYQWSGGINTTSAISSLVFSTTAGTFSSGTVLIYGVK